MGVLRRGQSVPPLHPVMVSLHVVQATPEAIGIWNKIMASTSAVELGNLEPEQDEPRPTGPCVIEPDPRDPCRDPAPPQIIRNHGRHTIVARDLSTQIHGELNPHHTCRNLRGNRSVEFCKLGKDSPYLLHSQS